MAFDFKKEYKEFYIECCQSIGSKEFVNFLFSS